MRTLNLFSTMAYSGMEMIYTTGKTVEPNFGEEEVLQ